MLRNHFFPVANLHVKPAFWGVDRDLKALIDDIEDRWSGNYSKASTADFQETEQAYLVSLDMPGINDKDLEIEVREDQVFIQATRHFRVLKNQTQASQKFSRAVILPKDVDREKIEAHCEDGVLYLALPKAESTKPKKININTGARNTLWDKLLGSNNNEAQKTE